MSVCKFASMRLAVPFLLFFSLISQAEPGKDGDDVITAANTVVNYYTGLTAVNTAGGITLTVSNIADLNDTAGVYDSVALTVGDLVMLYQAQGATIDTTDTAAFGDITAIGNAGRYELHEVISVSGNDIEVGDIGPVCTDDSLIYSFDLAQTQVIRVPQFNDLTVNVAASVVATPWNGTVGGVVALDVLGNLVINGSIDTSGQGFRGGVLENSTTPSGTDVAIYRSTSANAGAEKGESIVGFQAGYDALGGRFGRGAPANGGGGGNAHNGGGGGGANGDNGVTWNGQGNPDLSNASWTAAWDIDGTLTSATVSSGGGRGGYSFGNSNQDALTVAPGNAAWGGNNRRERGGLGGRPLSFDDAGRLFFGGGGGAGDANNSQGGSGGAGGGLIYILANNVSGAGAINNNGNPGENTQGAGNNDAPGGGGAGGTVVLSANSLAGIGINADGGVGGNQLTIGNESEGPGGGGGGGVISVSGGAITTSASGATNGTSASTAVNEFVPNGATQGALGQANETTGAVTTLPVCRALADVAVTKTLDTAGPYSNGQSIQYTIVVTNNGPSTATNVLVTDTPSNLTINTVSSTNCGAFPCTIPSLVNGASESITVTATINSAGAFDNVVVVSADQEDPDTSNNTDDAGNGGTATPAADVAVDKTLDTAGPFVNGQSIQYTITVTNNGPDTANNVQVVDTPTNITINTVSSTNCAAFPCTIPSLINGGSEVITVTATINASGVFDNVVTVSADEFDPDTNNNTDDAGNGGTAAPAADVAVDKTLDTAGPFNTGQSIQYTITVTNNGPDTANNVQVVDTPTNLTINTVSSTNCAAFPCTIPSLANGGSEVITVTATIDSSGVFDNVVTVSADEFDPDTNNNTDDAGNGGSAGTSADVAVVKVLDTAGPYTATQSIQYTITVSNNGPDTATNVQVVDTPTNLTINTVSSTNCAAFPCTIPSLINGGSEVITVTATINAGGAFDNVVTVSADQFDPDTNNNTDDAGNGGTAAPAADVAVDKTLDTVGPFTNGQSIQYTITVTNNGPDTANNVQVTDTPTNLTINTVSSTNCGAFPCTIPSLANGNSEVITVTATINANGVFDNVVVVSADEFDPDTDNNTDDSGNGGSAGSSADVAVVKDLDSSAPFNPGQTVQYTITVSNNGPDTATNIQVVDTPTNLTINTVSSANCGAFPCTIPSLINGASEVITVTATINSSGAFDNVVTVTADQFDPDTDNNTDDSGNGGNTGPSADVLVTKAITTAGPYAVGQTVDFSVVVTNNGPDVANNVVITDVPSNLVITAVNSPNCAAFPCTLPSLAVGATEAITVSATIQATGDFVNASFVTADEFDPDPNNNDDDGADGNNGGTVPLEIRQVPGLNLWGMFILVMLMLFLFNRQGLMLRRR